MKTTSAFFLFFFHLIFWVAFYLVPFIDPRGLHSLHNSFHPKYFFDIHLLINHAFFIFVFYLNSNYLIPNFFKKAKKIEFILIILFLITFILSLSFIIFPLLRLPKPPVGVTRFPDLNEIRLNQTIALGIPLLFVLMVSTTYRILRDKLVEEKLNKEKETENLKTELAFLRSQISPHFIFNALNSSIILVRKQSDLAESCLLKLASLLRYMLYEADEDKVLLENEMQYISDYIDLQGIRFGESVTITKNIEAIELLDHYIEPMLLIPFIENAFKHGTIVLKNPEIEVKLVEKQGTLLLEVKNKFVSIERESKNNGIGLTNVSRRLELLYPNKHILKLSIEKDWYSVYLSIDLTK